MNCLKSFSQDSDYIKYRNSIGENDQWSPSDSRLVSVLVHATGFKRTTLTWFMSHLSDGFHFVDKNGNDDPQLYISIKPNETCRLNGLQTCFNDRKTWMTWMAKFLLLNSCYWVTRHSEIEYVVWIGFVFASSTTVRNLGVIFAQNWSFKSHRKHVFRSDFFHLCSIVIVY